MQQADDRVDGHHIGSVETTREATGRRTGARTEIENSPRHYTNTDKTLEQTLARGQHDSRELGGPVAGAREGAPHRDSIDCRRYRPLPGWRPHHDHRVWAGNPEASRAATADAGAWSSLVPYERMTDTCRDEGEPRAGGKIRILRPAEEAGIAPDAIHAQRYLHLPAL